MTEQQTEFETEVREGVERMVAFENLIEKVSAYLLLALRNECELWYGVYETVMDKEALDNKQKQILVILQGRTNDLIAKIDTRITQLQEE